MIPERGTMGGRRRGIINLKKGTSEGEGE